MGERKAPTPPPTDQVRPAPPPAPPRRNQPRELLCMVCRRDHPVWFAPNDLWNRVMRCPDGSDRFPFVCPTCFARMASDAGVADAFELRVAVYPGESIAAPAQEGADRVPEIGTLLDRFADAVRARAKLDGNAVAPHNYWLGKVDDAREAIFEALRSAPPSEPAPSAALLAELDGERDLTARLRADLTALREQVMALEASGWEVTVGRPTKRGGMVSIDADGIWLTGPFRARYEDSERDAARLRAALGARESEGATPVELPLASLDWRDVMGIAPATPGSISPEEAIRRGRE